MYIGKKVKSNHVFFATKKLNMVYEGEKKYMQRKKLQHHHMFIVSWKITKSNNSQTTAAHSSQNWRFDWTKHCHISSNTNSGSNSKWRAGYQRRHHNKGEMLAG
jgi:hypothetical protein